jgi:hypothetical protein
MDKYPLYQTFACKNTKKDLTNVQKKKLCENISSLTQEQKTVLVRLIIEHSRLNNNNEKETLLVNIPYKGITKDLNIEFSLENIPIELKLILFKFTEVCTKND